MTTIWFSGLWHHSWLTMCPSYLLAPIGARDIKVCMKTLSPSQKIMYKILFISQQLQIWQQCQHR